MHEVMDLLEELHVGLDLLPLEEEKRFLRAYQEVLDELLALARGYLGRDEVMRAFRNLPRDQVLNRYFKITGVPNASYLCPTSASAWATVITLGRRKNEPAIM